MSKFVSFWLALFIVICFQSVVFSQKKEQINLTTGFGFTELLNIGIRFQQNQMQYGLSVGFIPVPEEQILSVSGAIYYHFGGTSKFSVRRP